MTIPEYHEELLISPWPRDNLHLQAKHCIAAIDEAGFAFARRPIQTSGKVPKLYAGLFLHNRQVGWLKWQHKPQSNMISTAGSTDLGNTIHQLADGSNAAVQTISKRTRAGHWHFGQYVIKYIILDQALEFTDIFTTFLDALSVVAKHDFSEKAGTVHGTGYSGNVHLKMQASSQPSALTYQRLAITLGNVFQQIVAWHAYQEWFWELFDQDQKLGEGYIREPSRSGIPKVVQE